MSDDVLVREQAHLVRARAGLRRMREHTQELLDGEAQWGNDPLTSRALAAALGRRFAALLDDGVTPLFFGRLDYDEAPDGPAGAEPAVAAPADPAADSAADSTFHIGRRHVTGEDGEPLVVDWRAPISQPFYRATSGDPLGVGLRRRFGFRDGALTAYEDDRLEAVDARGPAASALLVEEVERPRTGPMRDIVATIQPDQDVLVRAPLQATVCVQGAPGTGKTAVGLHRAAYLLYAHRQRLAATGVLVVGPNRAFLSYVQEVLPALGEIRVTQLTADDLAPPVRVRGTDTAATAVLKGDARMAAVLERALWLRATRASEPLVHASGARRWRVQPEQVRELERAVRGRRLGWDAGRAALAGALATALVRQMEDAGQSLSDRVVERLARHPDVKAYVDALWPPVTAAGLVFSVLADRSLLARAADGLLEPDEQALLAWDPPPATPGRVRWSPADLPLLDEAAHLVARSSGYAHVVLDEAQDLSAMQLRAVGRRCLTGSATVLGDLAQATTPWGARDWQTVLDHLGKPDGRVEPLTLGFRVPREVLELANRLLPVIAPELAPARSLRHVPGALTVRRLPEEQRAAAAAARVREQASSGSVAVVAADPALLAEVGAALAATGVLAQDLSVTGTPAPVSLVPAELVKGLEFDHVVLLEPADLAAAGTHGLRLLYVALTRAVTSLTVLYARDLPAELSG